MQVGTAFFLWRNVVSTLCQAFVLWHVLLVSQFAQSMVHCCVVCEHVLAVYARRELGGLLCWLQHVATGACMRVFVAWGLGLLLV